MVSLIVSPARLEAARKAAEDHGGTGYERVGPLDSAGIREAFVQAARGAAEVLILDLDAGPGPDIVAAMRRYRIQRPTTRVIVLAPGREPGDVTVAGIVARGVYDIIAAPEDAAWDVLVKQSLDRPPATYAQAARWDVDGQQEEQGQAKERVIIERRAARQTAIVLGSGPRTGATTVAVSLACHLARQGVPTLLVDVSPRAAIRACAGEQREDVGRELFRFRLREHLDVLARQTDGDESLKNLPPGKILEVAGRLAERIKAEAVVIDAGGVDRVDRDASVRSLVSFGARVFRAVPSALWFLAGPLEDLGRYEERLVLTPAGAAQAREVSQAWHTSVLPLPAGPVWEPESLGDWPADVVLMWREALAGFLPERKVERRRWFPWVS